MDDIKFLSEGARSCAGPSEGWGGTRKPAARARRAESKNGEQIWVGYSGHQASRVMTGLPLTEDVTGNTFFCAIAALCIRR